MNTTAYYGIDNNTGNVMYLGVGTAEQARPMADVVETLAVMKGTGPVKIGPILDIEGLYRIIDQAKDLLNNLPLTELEMVKKNEESE
jgi:hypothetical protein